MPEGAVIETFLGSAIITFFSSLPLFLFAFSFFSFPFPSLVWFWSLSGPRNLPFDASFHSSDGKFRQASFQIIGLMYIKIIWALSWWLNFNKKWLTGNQDGLIPLQWPSNYHMKTGCLEDRCKGSIGLC